MLQIDEFDFTKFLNNSIALLTFKSVQRWKEINWECRRTTKIMVRIITEFRTNREFTVCALYCIFLVEPGR